MKKRRNTTSTKEILRILEETNHAMSHDMLFTKLEGVNRATVYRILNRFCEDGITHRIIDKDGKQFFALCKQCSSEEHLHNHLHFQCTSCQRIECFGNELSLQIPKGYTANSFNGIVTGYCNQCS